MSRNLIATWFYQQEEAEGGEYAQVSGASHTEEFRDVYRRCIAMQYVTAREKNPDADLVLYLNSPWDRKASATAASVGQILDRIGVEQRVIEYSFRPPPDWTRWRNQFFVFDVLADLESRLGPGDLLLVLDSDIIWNPDVDPAPMWTSLGQTGSLLLEIPYQTTDTINGLSRQGLQSIGYVLGGSPAALAVPPRYAGGEFIGLRFDELRRVNYLARMWWPKILKYREEQPNFNCEEAHLISLLAAELGLNFQEKFFIQRIWTQPHRFRNADPSASSLTLWHLPAEKKYGLRRMYERQLKGKGQSSMLVRDLGVTGLRPRKYLLDVSYALFSRTLSRISGLAHRVGR